MKATPGYKKEQTVNMCPSVPGADLCVEPPEESGERLRLVISAAEGAESS